jgi:hypothetical protein
MPLCGRYTEDSPAQVGKRAGPFTMKLRFLILLLLASTLGAAEQIGPSPAANSMPPKSVNVKKSCGAAGDGVTDDSFAIQRCINRAHSGQTIYFPDGTYALGKPLNVKARLTYLGESAKAVLEAANMGEWILMFPNTGGKNITINTLTFEHGGINTLGNGETPDHIRITNCRFQNLTATHGDWQRQNFIYADNGLSHSQIDHNSFFMLLGNGKTRNNNDPNYDGDLPRSALFAFGLNETSVDHNTFDRVYQAIKVCQVFPFKAQNVYIGWNVMTRLHRMGIEVQGPQGCGRQQPAGVPINTKNFTIEHNSMTDWDDYYWLSFGISFANPPVDTAIIRDNLIVGSEYYDAPGVPAAHPAMGIEAAGQPVHVYNNRLKGPWGAAIAVFSGSMNGEVHHNVACNVNKNGHAPTIADENNPAPTNTRYHDNTTEYPCSRVGMFRQLDK